MQRNAKPKATYKFTPDDFPELPFADKTDNSSNKSKWTVVVNKDTEYDFKALMMDKFEGYYDDQGVPIYGKIDFANGNTYTGPIFSSFPQDVEIQHDESDTVFEFQDETIEYDRDPYENYGEMIYPDGTSFWGVFCFGKQVIYNLVKQ